MKAETIGRVIVVDVRRQSSQPTGTFGAHRGARFKTLSHSQEQEKINQDEKHEAKNRCTEWMRKPHPATDHGNMQALQEMVAASRVDQEHIQIDLAASLARNDEL